MATQLLKVGAIQRDHRTGDPSLQPPKQTLESTMAADRTPKPRQGFLTQPDVRASSLARSAVAPEQTWSTASLDITSLFRTETGS
jgi:hypothetical protein